MNRFSEHPRVPVECRVSNISSNKGLSSLSRIVAPLRGMKGMPTCPGQLCYVSGRGLAVVTDDLGCVIR